MRRLPVYLVLDTSGSMSGEPIEAVKNGVQTLVAALRTDPFALETAYLSIITFDTTARQVVPLTELPLFQVPNINAQGQTALGDALVMLADCVSNEVKKTTSDEKGDWKPIVFIMTDGEPTDEWQKSLVRFKSQRYGMVIACAAGQSVNTDILKNITDTVVQLDTADSNTIKSFFKWVSASISTGSQRVEQGSGEPGSIGDLPPPPSDVNIVM